MQRNGIPSKTPTTPAILAPRAALGPIESSCSELHEQIGFLANAIDEMASRLQPVLRPENVNQAGPGTDPSRGDSISDLNQAINHARNKTIDLRLRLQSLLERIDL